MAGIDCHDDAGNLFHRDRDVAGMDVRGLLHLPRLTVPTGKARLMTRDSVASRQGRRRAAPATTGGIEPTGRGGCCGVIDMLNGAPGYSKKKEAAPAGSGMPHGMGIGR